MMGHGAPEGASSLDEAALNEINNKSFLRDKQIDVFEQEQCLVVMQSVAWS